MNKAKNKGKMTNKLIRFFRLVLKLYHVELKNQVDKYFVG